MQFNNYLFKGTITSVQPLNITLAKTKGMPVDSHGNPMIPATSLRGAIRNAGHRALTLLRAEQGKGNFTIDEHYMLASGVDTARQGSIDEAVGASYRLRQENPFISIFGRWQLGGKFQIGNAVANKESLLLMGNGTRQHVFERQPELVNYIESDSLEYLADILAADAYSSEQSKGLRAEEKELRGKIRNVEGAERKKISDRLDKIELEIRAIKDERVGASETVRRPLDGFQVIDANTEMPHRMVLSNPSDDEFKTLLFCLYALSKEPFVGGHRNVGCGHFHAKWNIVKTSFNENSKVIGSIQINDDGFIVDVDGITVDDIVEFGKQLSINESLTKFF